VTLRGKIYIGALSITVQWLLILFWREHREEAVSVG
jgi:hypothetical protein